MLFITYTERVDVGKSGVGVLGVLSSATDVCCSFGFVISVGQAMVANGAFVAFNSSGRRGCLDSGLLALIVAAGGAGLFLGVEFAKEWPTSLAGLLADPVWVGW